MKNLKKSAVVLCAVFASMQITMAGQFDGLDVGLGKDFGGSQVNHATDGLVGVSGQGTGNVDMNFNANTHVNWDHLNVGRGESLNFNAVDGASGLTVLNSVNKGMTNVYGSINANSGIANLIIANPNGVLFDGATFTTAGDAMITTKDLSALSAEDLAKFDINNAKYTNLYNGEGKLIPIEIRNNSTFNIGGDYNIVAAGIKAANSTITAKNVRLITANGQDYLALNKTAPTKQQAVAKLTAMNINGNLYVTNEAGAFSIENGGTINGNVNVNTAGSVHLNTVNNGNKLTVNGDVDVKGNGARMYLRNAEVDGNLKMVNGGGSLDIGDVHVTKNADITTTNESQNYDNGRDPVKHFVHVVGNTSVDGNLTVESEHNIHIGGYNFDEKKLLDGKLTVGGDLTAHAKNGHVMTTIDTTAGNKISLKSDNYNVLTDGKATLTAKEYEFAANGYIGGLTSTENMNVDEKVINIMENYIPIPNTVGTPGNLNIAGGTITALNTSGGNANILSKGDVILKGANAGTINITAPNHNMEITGDVHAKDINVGKETDRLKVDFASRDYDLNYTNIRDNKEVSVKGNEEITYDLTDGKGGHNDGEQVKGENTYLVGPGAPVDDDPTDPAPERRIDPEDNENVKVLRSFENKSVDLNQVYAPVAYAADLDDDQSDTGVRKNVDGSVTVVRAFPMD